ncbi:LysR family transcriptional regulator [Sulfitobacter sp.]|uniref:LysR family transcriptional regulator n=1 Tax=Sulfitobacter sp. TaxID=1903071 RepID=UPI003299B5E0
MDTRQLETLLAIEQHGGFAAAAQVVNLTASAVSQQITALEAEIGAELFDRSRRPPMLTAKGIEMVRSARSILNIVSETKASVTAGRVRGTMAFGSLRTFSNTVVPTALAALRTRYPELNFRLRVGKSEELMNNVASGQLDAALVADHVTVPGTLRWTPVIEEPLVVLTPTGCGDMSLEDLVRNVHFIRYRTQVPLARQIDTEMAKLGVALKQIASVNTMTAVVGCVRAGLGFAVVPQIALDEVTRDTLDRLPFGTPPITRTLGVVQRMSSRQEEITGALIDALTEL